MKRIFNTIYLPSLLVLLLAFACTDEFSSPSEGDVPLAADIDAEVMVDQETNEVTFMLNNETGYPVWIIQEPGKKVYSTVNGFKKVYTLQGTYSVEIKIGNANGISDGSITKEFVVENSLLDPNPGGYDSDNDCNLWKAATFTNQFYYAPGWSQIADPGFVANGNMYNISLPAATTDQWQAQVMYRTNMSTVADKNYDFSAVFHSTKAHPNVTVKLVQTGDDNNFFFTSNIALEANTDYVFIKTNMPGKAMANVSLVLDFGGNAEGTEIIVRRIALKEHACDDGTDIEEPVEDTVNWLPDSDCNKWKGVTYVNHFFYAPGWAAIYEGPSYSGFTAGANTYALSYPTATTDQWQNQVHFRTSNVATEAGKNYDFRVILNATKNISQVTIKLTKVGDDATFYFTERVDLVAGQDYIFKKPAMPGKAIDNIALVFDFAGNPADTQVNISSIILKESTCND